ncbi:MAG: HEAT repeat domain-containing protein [Planctomycetes bacterium]|nr:HEAT repeat domain-containing protein [Planctomycetota bacterium]
MKFKYILTALLVLMALSACQTRELNKPRNKNKELGFKGAYSEAELSLMVELDTLLKQWQSAFDSVLVEQQQKTAEELKQKVTNNFYFIARMIQTDDLEVKLIASGVLGFSEDKKAVPLLMGTLADQNELIRTNTLFGIGFIGDKETPVNPILQLLLNDQSAEVRSASAFAIARIIEIGKPRGTTASLIKALDDPDASVRKETVRALAVGQNSQAINPLINKALADKDTFVVAHAILALASLKATAAIEPLINLLKKDDSYIQENTLNCLEYITGAKAGKDFKSWQEWWEKNKSYYKTETR